MPVERRLIRESKMYKLGLAHLTALNLNPAQLLELAAEVGFSSVGLRLIRVNEESPGYPLMDDPQMMRETLAAIKNTGVSVNDIEFLRIFPQTRPEDYLGFLDAGAELGAKHVIFAPYDEDLARFAQTLGRFAELCNERSLQANLEFFPWTPVKDLDSCWQVIQESGSNFSILIDPLHFDRSHSRIDLLASLPSDRLRFAQLCDAPVKADYSTEELFLAARAERLAPGQGQIDLKAILDQLPTDIPISLEIPQLGREQSLGTREVVKALFDDTQKYLEEIRFQQT